MTAFKIFFSSKPSELENKVNVWHGKHNVTIENWRISAEGGFGYVDGGQQNIEVPGGLWMVIEYTDLDVTRDVTR